MKRIGICLFFLLSISVFGQKRINDYKFIIVSEKFSFLKKKDQYQTSSLTKFLFNKYGFYAFFSSDSLPQDLINNNCNALYVDIVNNSALFTTKLSIEFKDCLGNLIYKSTEGKSRKKEYKIAYHEAIRNAFEDSVIQEYMYVSKDDIINTKKQIESELKGDILKKKVSLNDITVLYAQKNKNGYQMVDNTPKIIFKVLSTSKKNLFVMDDKKGVLFSKDDYWVAEFYENSKLIRNKYIIKF